MKGSFVLNQTYNNDRGASPKPRDRHNAGTEVDENHSHPQNNRVIQRPKEYNTIKEK
jgi:hypothetical protein